MSKHLKKIKGLGVTPLLSEGMSFFAIIPRVELLYWSVERLTTSAADQLAGKNGRRVIYQTAADKVTG
jgi:hypothetical protein